jgi:hypothetical protein
MKSKLIFFLVLIVAALGLTSCEDLPPVDEGTDTGANKVVQGQVRDLASGELLQNAVVYLTFAGSVDSVTTGVEGVFRFEINLNASTDDNASLQVWKTGYQPKTVNFTAVSDTSLTVLMSVDLSTSALLTGVLRDSATSYPIRNAIVLLTMPGVVETFETGTDGLFRMYADLVDRDSMPVSLTTVKDGYKTRTVTVVCYPGQTKDVGNVLLQVDAGSTIGQVAGRVTDFITNLPVNNATVVLNTPIFVDSLTTSGDGGYSFSVNLQGLAGVSGTVRVSKNGYTTTTFPFTVSAGQILNTDVRLERDTTTGVPPDPSGTGDARSIAFVNLSANQVSVAGVGGTESSIITWEVRDSLGFPIDIDHSDTVFFQLSGVPVSGGAYVSPSWAITNVAGRVATTINSGTVSGVLQFTATLVRNSDGAVISSTPVVITVNAGLPAQSHFTIGPRQFNFAAYNWLGRTNDITVQVGDKYSNPVKTGTAVYFNTTGGVIAASGFTDPTSHATVVLYSGNPLPRDATSTLVTGNPALFGDGTGYAWIRAHSLGESSVNVVDSVLILFSGVSSITLSANVVHIDSGGCVDVSVTVADQNGNPLAPGTLIATEVEFTPPEGTNWSVLASGLPEDPLADHLTRGNGSTAFTLRICDGTPGGTPQRMPFNVKISVTGPNGNTFATVSGDVGP